MNLHLMKKEEIAEAISKNDDFCKGQPIQIGAADFGTAKANFFLFQENDFLLQENNQYFVGTESDSLCIAPLPVSSFAEAADVLQTLTEDIQTCLRVIKNQRKNEIEME